MFQFRDKTIVIITREKWGVMKISKHHYALELAKNHNCTVFFVETPQLYNGGLRIKNVVNIPI